MGTTAQKRYPQSQKRSTEPKKSVAVIKHLKETYPCPDGLVDKDGKPCRVMIAAYGDVVNGMGYQGWPDVYNIKYKGYLMQAKKCGVEPLWSELGRILVKVTDTPDGYIVTEICRDGAC